MIPIVVFNGATIKLYRENPRTGSVESKNAALLDIQ